MRQIKPVTYLGSVGFPKYELEYYSADNKVHYNSSLTCILEILPVLFAGAGLVKVGRNR